MVPSSVWIFLIVTSSCLSLQQEAGPAVVQLRYRQRTMTPPSGSNIQLDCTAYYNLVECGWVHVKWCRDPPDCVELKNLTKYFTTVNETIDHGSWRERSVVTRIFAVTRDDSGLYQCMASCEQDATASGHLITVAVDSV